MFDPRWQRLVEARDYGAAVLAAVGLALTGLVWAAPRKWRRWAILALAIYAVAASYASARLSL